MAEDQEQRGKKVFALGLISIAAVLLGAFALSIGFFQQIENDSWDRRLGYVAKHVTPDPKIRIIMIDQSSLDYFAREEKHVWPWPRSLYEPVVKYLQHAGAKAVAFDILFTEPSSYGVEDDMAFADSMQCEMKVVIAMALRNTDLFQPADELESFRKKMLSEDERDGFSTRYMTGPRVPVFRSATLPIPELVQKCHAVGNVSSSPDSDGIFRHAVPGGYIQDIPVLSLPFALYNAAVTDRMSEQEFANLYDREGRLTVQFAGPARTYHTDPIAAVIQSYVQIDNKQAPLIDPADYKDAYVFVGMDAPGLLDLRPIPLSEVYPGVEYNATIFDNLLHKKFIKKFPNLATLSICFLLSLLCAAVVLFEPGVIRQTVLLLALFGVFIWGAFQAALLGLWVPMVLPLILSTLTLLVALAYQYRMEGRQLRFIRHAFRHYVSPEVIKRIVEDPSTLSLGGDRRELTIFFSDIEGFTSISETLDATKLVALLNTFLSEMAQIILESGGTVDKYVGDAIVAFWNAPVQVPDHAVRGTIAALKCQKRLTELREQLKRDYGVSIRMRVGLHTGTVSVGNFGSKDRFNYTVVGDAANLASRLEGANKSFGTYALMSEDTRSRLGDAVYTRKLADIVVVGKSKGTSVYEPFELPLSVEMQSRLEKFSHALKLYESGALEEALAAFRLLTEDPPAAKYVAKIEKDLERRAAGKEWSPLWNMTEK